MDKNIKISEDFSYPSEQQWKKAAEKLLKGRPFEKTLYSLTDEGITIKPIYFPDLPATSDIPGVFPFTRGMKGKKDQHPWLINQTIYTTNDVFNDVAKTALKNGQNALNIDLDLVSQYADSAPEIPNRLGNIHIRDLNAFKNLFENIDLQSVPLFFDALCRADDIAGWLSDYAEINNFDKGKIRGGFGADPLSASLKYGGFPKDPEQLNNEIAAVCKLPFPNMDVLTISAEFLHNCGANKIQELSYVLSSAVYYINNLQKSGISPEKIISRMRVKLAVGSEQLMEIAKIRALRMLWANMCKAFDIPENEISLKIDAVTSWRSLSYFDPWSNMLRSTGQVFSAVCGGVNSLDVLPFDLAMGQPDDFSRRIARNVQLIFSEEAFLSNIIDPGAGSGVIEELTQQISEKSWQMFQEIENKGGVFEIIKNGQLQGQIIENEKIQLNSFNKRKRKVIGANIYPDLHEKRPQKQQEQIETGQITHSSEWPIEPLHEKRIPEHFEKLRMKLEKIQSRPQLLLLQIGDLKDYKARSEFARDFFMPAGFEVIEQHLIDTKNIEILPVPLCVICSSDEKYNQEVNSLIQIIKEKYPDLKIVLTGNPGENESDYRQSGIDDFIYMGSNMFEQLQYFMSEVYKIT